MFIIWDSPIICSEDTTNGQLKPVENEVILEISFHTITGTDYPQIVCVIGQLKNKKVMLLINDGNTHDFVNEVIVSKFELLVNQEKKFQVMVANREKIDCVGQCWALTINIEGYPVTVDFHILPIAACQLVLRV